VPPAVLRRHLDAYTAWKAARDAAVAAARQPSIDVVTATAAAANPDLAPMATAINVATETVEGSASRPGGQRFGSLVHALLADVPLDALDSRAVATLASAHGRVFGADAAEVAAAAEVVHRVLRHPVLEAAARAAREGRCYREMPVTWRSDAGALIEGFVDLAFADEDGFVVVDFKTDRELEGAVERYQRQVTIYAAAIATATGRSTRAVLMRV
jgi:ATP-dependent helicase/nuclease subunit A